jgi:hypothetical protein
MDLVEFCTDIMLGAVGTGIRRLVPIAVDFELLNKFVRVPCLAALIVHSFKFLSFIIYSSKFILLRLFFTVLPNSYLIPSFSDFPIPSENNQHLNQDSTTTTTSYRMSDSKSNASSGPDESLSRSNTPIDWYKPDPPRKKGPSFQ